MLALSVPLDSPPISMKDFLRKQSGISLTSWRKLKQDGTILINGHPFNGYQLLQAGDCITLYWPEVCQIKAVDIPLTICYEDDHFLIIDKPAGMLVHPTGGEHENTVGNGVLFYYQKAQLSYSFHPVHRLDRNTSGLLVIAKHPHLQHMLSRPPHIKMHRTYQAIVSGEVREEESTIDAPIARHPDSIIQRIVDSNGQSAQTHFRIIERLKDATSLELVLLTGRTHQIRVHCSHIGHPLLGDDLYGGSRVLLNRHALHSSKISFTNPITKTQIDVTASLANDLENLLHKLRVK